MDDQDKFLAALNVEDFDASLLNCWVSGKIDAKSAGGSSNNSNSGGRQSGSMSPRSNHSVGGGSVGDGYFTQLPPLNTMLDDDGINKNCGIGGGHGSTPPHSANTAAGSSATGASVWPAFIPKQAQHVQGSSPSAPTINAQRKLSPVPVSTSVSIASSNTKGGASRGSSIRPQNKNQAQAQHQLNYNPHNQQHNNNGIMQTSDTSSAISNTAAMQLHPLAIQSSANCPPHTMQSSGFGGMQNNFFPTAMSSLQGNNHVAFAAGIPFQSASSQLSNANALLFQSMSAANDNNSATTTNNLGNNTNNSTTGQQQQRKATRGAAASNNSNTTQQQQQQPSSGNNASSASGSSASMPPFYLFDAPCELRANFMQSQRMHGLPVAEDSNSYHYGVAVNGFHPMNLAAGQSSTSNNFSGNAAATNANSVKLIDARHGNRKAGRIKNEREQRRAQKITELMEQIRASLVTGGWEVRDKSKFHTLSS